MWGHRDGDGAKRDAEGVKCREVACEKEMANVHIK